MRAYRPLKFGVFCGCQLVVGTVGHTTHRRDGEMFGNGQIGGASRTVASHCVLALSAQASPRLSSGTKLSDFETLVKSSHRCISPLHSTGSSVLAILGRMIVFASKPLRVHVQQNGRGLGEERMLCRGLSEPEPAAVDWLPSGRTAKSPASICTPNV